MSSRSSFQPRLAAFGVAALLGAALWALSPWLTGHREAWDSESLYYSGGLLAAGLASGLLVPRPLWPHYPGAVAGQLAYMLLFLPIGPLILIGIGFLLAYSLLFLGGAVAGGLLRRAVDRPD